MTSQVHVSRRDPDVIFATPSLSHTVSLRHHRSCLETEWLLHRMGLSSGYMQRGGDCFIAKVRNKLVSDFLRQFPTAQNFFFLDDDIGWPAAKVIEFIMRPEDVIAGAYPKKSKELDFPVTLAVNKETGELIEQNGLLLALMVPAGFMRIKRHVLERLAAGAREFEEQDADGSVNKHRAIFESGMGPDGKWWGEDYTFGHKWIALGGQMWVDPTIKFDHMGANTWTDTMASHLNIYRSKAKEVFAETKSAEIERARAVLAEAQPRLAEVQPTPIAEAAA